MRRFALFLLSLMMAVSLAADVLEYNPVREGMEWTMDVTVTTSDGRSFQSLAHRKIEPPEERGGKTYFRMRTWSEPKAGPDSMMLIRRDEAGCFTLALEAAAVEQAETRFPVVIGKKWKKQIDGEERTCEVIAMEVVTIGEKRYEDCAKIRVTRSNGEVTENIWEAPGIGCVRSEVSLPSGVKIVLTLREFKPGKK